MAQDNAVTRMIDELRKGSNDAPKNVIAGLVSAFNTKEDARGFDLLLEFLTWLFFKEYKGDALVEFYRNIVGSRKVSEERIRKFINHCNPLIYDEHRREEVPAILDGIGRDLDEFLAEPVKTLNDQKKLQSMMTKATGILKKHKSFMGNTVDTARRGSLLCLIMLHEEKTCKTLTEDIIELGLDKSENYSNLKSRKREDSAGAAASSQESANRPPSLSE